MRKPHLRLVLMALAGLLAGCATANDSSAPVAPAVPTPAWQVSPGGESLPDLGPQPPLPSRGKM